MTKYEECEGCTRTKLPNVDCMIFNRHYNMVSYCPCKECILKTNCSTMCQDRVNVWKLADTTIKYY